MPPRENPGPPLRCASAVSTLAAIRTSAAAQVDKIIFMGASCTSCVLLPSTQTQMRSTMNPTGHCDKFPPLRCRFVHGAIHFCDDGLRQFDICKLTP
jgi:hypothetical protein